MTTRAINSSAICLCPITGIRCGKCYAAPSISPPIVLVSSWASVPAGRSAGCRRHASFMALRQEMPDSESHPCCCRGVSIYTANKLNAPFMSPSAAASSPANSWCRRPDNCVAIVKSLPSFLDV